MPELDCQNFDTALKTLSEAIGIPPNALAAEVLAFDEETTARNSGMDDPAVAIPRAVLGNAGVEVEDVRIGSACYFHGTRVLDPTAFATRGLLPLNEMLDEIWDTLYHFVRDECTPVQWRAFRCSIEGGAGGRDGDLYRLKTRSEIHYGPYGLLVRELFFNPEATSSHDYLGSPEIIQDIARAYEGAHGQGLEDRFRVASFPCIVKFRSRNVDANAVTSSFWYVYSQLRKAQLPIVATSSGFVGQGVTVPRGQILQVETIS